MGLTLLLLHVMCEMMASVLHFLDALATTKELVIDSSVIIAVDTIQLLCPL